MILLLASMLSTFLKEASANPSTSNKLFSIPNNQIAECGLGSLQRQPRLIINHDNEQNFFNNERAPKIISGTPTKEGQFPWQASLELLHPSIGFLGHWCGGVLIDKFWVLSAAHCVHNDLFNFPLPPLWTVVLGEYNRVIESGYEQRIPVEKIVLHKSYHNFRNDLVLMKLSVPANLAFNSNIRKICLPFTYNKNVQSDYSDNNFNENIFNNNQYEQNTQLSSQLDEFELMEKDNNFLRKIRSAKNTTLPSMKELLTTKIIEKLKKTEISKRNNRTNHNFSFKRRNDKLMTGFSNSINFKSIYDNLMDFQSQQHNNKDHDYDDLPYIDCVATGWGKFNLSGDLTDILLKTNVPLHNNARCNAAYGSFVKIHKGHLCAGKLNGKGGSCVGDSGGPLQCRLTKNGPWILAGVTSFGSGCALEGFPDVYTRISFYMKWILDTINNEKDE